ncbi:amidohydrolase family protein [Solihabitans fulvus]|uniref:Amidohydrolase family protein n=1 Tax=Solihabitans fulvus TaxID=1892852 RepID=A0A5B2XFH5_9PSEU|nr:amidohydrolase family protein [Solihabitans fulvus]KAA2261641.1 amidohydrolase family protein [Solihabitans fulvus]
MTRTVFTGGTLFDGTGAAAADADVAIEDGRIVEVGHGLDGDESIDASGHTLLPGMFDCHVHVVLSGVNLLRDLSTPFSLQFYEAAANLRTTLATGITTVRDAGGADLGIAEAVRRGLVPGPRMQIAINMLSQTGGHGDDWMPCGTTVTTFVPHPGRPGSVVDGPAEVRRKVRELIRDGADVIKVATSGGVLSPTSKPKHAHFRDDEVAEMVAEATAAGIHVMAHAQGTEGILTAVRNGIRSIEHGIFLTDEAIGLMLERGTWLVPTLVAPRMAIAAADGLPTSMVDKAKSMITQHTESVRAAIAAGVRIAMGTDSGVGPHGDNLDELALLVECGMTPAQALHAATRSAAELMSLDQELGTVEPGKRADLVLVEGDAEALIPQGGAALRAAIRGVWQDGTRVA